MVGLFLINNMVINLVKKNVAEKQRSGAAIRHLGPFPCFFTLLLICSAAGVLLHRQLDLAITR